MTIKGIWSNNNVKKKIKDLQSNFFKTDDHIAVDLMGSFYPIFMYNSIEKSVEIIKKKLSNFTNITIFIDGRKSIEKKETHAIRREQYVIKKIFNYFRKIKSLKKGLKIMDLNPTKNRIRKVQRIKKGIFVMVCYLNIGAFSLRYNDKQEIQKLFHQQGFPTVLCEGESDVEIHRLQGFDTVITRDGDYMLMSNIKFILRPERGLLYKKIPTNGITCQQRKKYLGCLATNDDGQNMDLSFDDLMIYVNGSTIKYVLELYLIESIVNWKIVPNPLKSRIISGYLKKNV